MMNWRDLKQIREAAATEERLSLIFPEGSFPEAMVERDCLNPIECVTGRKDHVMEAAYEIDLDVGQTVLFHETTREKAENIVEQGFGNPYDFFGQDSYHVPGSKRYRKVFCWPHLTTLGRNDVGGTCVVCDASIQDVLVSSYESFAQLHGPDEYEWHIEMGRREEEMLLPGEYDEYHVFNYREYLDWLEENSEKYPKKVNTLLPYKTDNQ